MQVAVGSLPGDLDPTSGVPFTTGGPGPFDLIVLSEVGYYFDVPTLAVTIDRLCHALLPHGILVGTHWSGHSADHRLHADEVHATINAHTELKNQREERHPGFLLGRWGRREKPNAT